MRLKGYCQQCIDSFLNFYLLKDPAFYSKVSSQHALALDEPKLFEYEFWLCRAITQKKRNRKHLALMMTML